ncbi:ensconsin-like isoform X2 [Myxocyprinus asiaticus]|uniref:ensconsin-like isoform X2 n=1 Tax=Myxocyprinus asiaticus TaxID=70543 RepID=UPI0022226F65|nr:ensconsin-like isoform X2 [Myxocyprinus asiaticus]
MAEGATSLKGLRAQIAAAAQAQAEERRSQAGNTPTPAAPASTTKSQTRPVIDGAALKIDDKLRVAKERREEQEKQQAVRESQLLERERKAQLQVERQMEERQKKLEEQRRKEEQRRVAVEEKRKQKLEEEKEHYEAVMRRTLERSQRVEQRQKRWSWGGLPDSDNKNGQSDSGSTSSPISIVVSPASPVSKPPRIQTSQDKRSSSTVNLKQTDSVISKRLSSSSTLLNSPVKSAKQRSSSLNRLPSNAPQASKEAHKQPQVETTGPKLKKRSSSLSRVGAKTQLATKPEKPTSEESARRSLAAPVDSGVLSRLLTPTQASLARSKSTAALSGDGADAQASASPLQPPARGPLRSRSSDRKKVPSTSVSADSIASMAQQKGEKEKRFTSPLGKRPASPSSRHRSPSPAPTANTTTRTPSPGAAKQSPRLRPPSPSGLKQRPPSPQSSATSKPPPIQKPALTPTGPPTLRKRDSKPKDLSPMVPVTPQSPDTSTPSPVPAPKTKEDPSSKVIAGTNSAAEASKILAENRRLAREQKEKEEQLRIQKEEEERLRKEEEKRLAEEEHLRQAEEEKRLAEEKKREEEEQARKAEEERQQAELEEQQRQVELQKEREEAEVKAQEEAEKQRQERIRILEQNQQERMERKRRIEEIMKRTRKTDQMDFRGNDEKGIPDENEEEAEDQIDCEYKVNQAVKSDQSAKEAEPSDSKEHHLSVEEPVTEHEEPDGSVNGETDVDDKENINGPSTEDPSVDSPPPKSCLMEGSEFVNEDSKVGLVPGLNGKGGTWSFEELIDLGVHAKGKPLSDDGGPEGPRVAFEEKTSSLHPAQPIEALSEM